MIEWNANKQSSEYEVRVGHMRVLVRGRSPEEVIHQARLRLSREMPRMWDVIHGLPASRFQLTCRAAS